MNTGVQPRETRPAGTGAGQLPGKAMADVIARMGWMPSHPTFNGNPLDLSDEAHPGACSGRPDRRGWERVG